VSNINREYLVKFRNVNQLNCTDEYTKNENTTRKKILMYANSIIIREENKSVYYLTRFLKSLERKPSGFLSLIL
jgi:hypothetical protein